MKYPLMQSHAEPQELESEKIARSIFYLDYGVYPVSLL
jgi:hypothetical protein